MDNDGARDVIARTLFEMDGIEPPVDRGHPIWHNYLTDAKAILAAIAAKGLVIQFADEADARVAVARREGMERAAVILEEGGEGGFSEHDDEEFRRNYAAAIRVDMLLEIANR